MGSPEVRCFSGSSPCGPDATTRRRPNPIRSGTPPWRPRVPSLDRWCTTAGSGSTPTGPRSSSHSGSPPGGAYLDVETGEGTTAEREFYHCYTGSYGACCPFHGETREALVVTPEGSQVRSVASYTTTDLARWHHEDGSLAALGVEERDVFRMAVGEGVWLDSRTVQGDLEFRSPGGTTTAQMKGNVRPSIVVHDRHAYAVWRTRTTTGGSSGNLLVWVFSFGSARGGEAGEVDIIYETGRSRFRLPASE